MKTLMIGLLAIWLMGALHGLNKKLPPGLAQKGPWRSVTALDFIYDLNYERAGERVLEQRVLAVMLEEIARAERLVVIDMFLFNRFGGREVLGEELTSPVESLTEALVAARRQNPELAVLMITDEINTGYGSHDEPHLRRLADHGVEVVITDLSRLPDSNPIYSGVWRPFLQWFKPDGEGGRLPNPFAGEAPGLELASYLRLFNFKANHRKVLLTERVAVISSGNLHDASARHSNIAFRVEGEIIADLLAAELAVARFSGHTSVALPPLPATGSPPAGPDQPLVRLLTENAIREALLQSLAATTAGDRIWVAQFYLTERQVMAALAAAARRGVQVRLILDPSRDAFGRDKYGIPNRSMAARLKSRGGDNLEIRWYHTGGEQFHAKLLMIDFAAGDQGGTGRRVIIGGSANLTRRNLAGYNLESALEIQAAAGAPVAVAVSDFFHRLWHNRDGRYLVDYAHYAEDRPFKAAWVAWQEFSGMGTF